jgi:hypothetical protein
MITLPGRRKAYLSHCRHSLLTSHYMRDECSALRPIQFAPGGVQGNQKVSSQQIQHQCSQYNTTAADAAPLQRMQCHCSKYTTTAVSIAPLQRI